MCQSALSVFLPTAERGQSSSLPRPLRPDARRTPSDEEDIGRGSLSDYSDYASSDEETHNKNARNAASSSNDNPGRRAYPGTSDLDVSTKKGLLDEDDPFADPFGDSNGVDDSSIRGNGKQRVW